MSGKAYVILTLAIVLIIFAIQNNTLVDIRFLFWGISNVRLIFILLFGLILGASIVFILRFMKNRKPAMKLKDPETYAGNVEPGAFSEEEKTFAEDKETEDIEEDERINSEGVSMGSDYKGGFFNL